MLVLRWALCILWGLENPVEASPDDSKTFIRYFETNWVCELSTTADTWPLPIAANRENVAVIDDPGRLRCIDRNSGNIKWTTHVQPNLQTVPTLSDDMVFVATRKTSKIDAYRISDGQLLWSIKLGSAAIVFCRFPSLVVGSNLVFAVTTNGAITAISQQTGEMRWTRELRIHSEVVPLVWQNRLFVATHNDGILALDVRTGQTLWQRPLDSRVAVDIIHDELAVYFVTSSCMLYKVSCDTGDVMWKVPIPRAQLAPIVIGPRIAIIGDVTAGSTACLVTVDSSTGLIVQRRICPRVALTGLFDGKFLWCTTAYNELYLFDANIMCPRIILRLLPMPLRVISDSPSPLVLVGKQLIAGGVNEDAIRLMKYRGSLGVEPNGAQLLVIALFVILVIVLIWLAFSGGNTIPPTHETTGMMYGWCILAGVASIFLILDAVLICGLIGYERVTVLRVVSILALSIPPVGLLASWLVHMFRSHGIFAKLSRLQIESHEPVVRESFVDLTSRLYLDERVELLTVSEGGISPYVFWTAFKRNVLVVPHNLHTMCRRACNNDSILTNGLIRMILAHEMAHLIAKDVVLVPLVRTFRSYMVLSVMLLIGVSVALVRYPDAVLSELVRPALVIGCFVGALAITFAIRFSHARETVADATATLAVSPPDLAILLTHSSQGVSPLEAFLFILSMTPATAITRDHRVGVPFAISTEMINRLRTDAAERRSAFFERSNLLPQRAHNTIVAVVLASLTAGIIYQVLSETFVVIVALSDIHSVINHVSNIAIFKACWRDHPPLLAAAIWMLAPFLSAVAASATLLLPLRDSFFQDIRANSKALTMLCVAITACAALANLISSWIGRITESSRLPSSASNVSTLPCGVAIAVVGIFMLAMILVKWASILKQPRRGRFVLLSTFGVIFAVSGLAYFAFTGISVSARILLLIVSAGIAAILSSSVRRVFTRSGYIHDEWLNYDGVFARWQFTVDHPALERKEYRRAILCGVSIGCINYAVLMIVAASLAYPLLVRFEGWYDQHLPILYEKIVELNNLLSGDQPPAMASVIWQYGATAVLLAMTEYKSITAGEAVLWLALLLIGVLLVVNLVLEIVCRYASPFTRVSYVPILERLSILLGVNLVPVPFLQQYIKSVLRYMSAAEPYLQWPRYVPRMKATCQALPLIGSEISAGRRIATCDWVHQCAAPGGGFGCSPGEPPNPLHTHAALELLMPIGVLPDEEASQHSIWIAHRIQEMLASVQSFPPTSFLSYIALLLESQKLISLRSLSADVKKAIHTQVMQCWVDSEKSIEDTRNAIIALRLMEIEDSLLFEDLRVNWLPQKETGAVSLDPKTKLTDILFLVEIESSLFPQEFRSRACVTQITATLKDAFSVRHTPMMGRRPKDRACDNSGLK